ncbi:MAG: carboxypeptidase regulatory-like domain-containing protein [Planctomycetota bacterium]
MSVRQQFALYLASLVTMVGLAVLLMRVEGPAEPSPALPAPPEGQAALPAAAVPTALSVATAAPLQAMPPADVPSRVAREQLAARAEPKVAGRVLDEGGRAIAGASVTLRGDDRELRETTSDEGGGFALPLARGERAALLVDHPEYAGAVMRNVSAGNHYEVHLAVGVTLSGTVRCARTGAPIDGALVVCVPDGGQPRFTHTDARGVCSMPRVKPGKNAYVLCLAFGWEAFTGRVDLPGAADLELEPGTELDVRVIDGISHAPIEGATVLCKMPHAESIWFHEVPQAPSFVLSTDVDGRFRLPAVGRRSTTITIEAQGYVPYALRRGDAEVRLFGRLSLVGRVLDPAGAPVTGARVRLMEGRGTPPAETDAEGRFRFPDLDPYVPLVFGACHRDFAPTKSDCLALPLRDEELVLTLSPASCIRGRVLDWDGQPRASVRVNLGRVMNEAKDRDVWRLVDHDSTTAADGWFEQRSLPPGEYYVSTITEPMATARVQLGAGQTSEVTLTVPRCGPIEGVCIDASDQPLRNVLIRTELDGQTRWHGVQTGEHGEFAIRYYPPGVTVKVMASAEALSATATVATPARDVVLRLAKPRKLTGVVTSRGVPVMRFAVSCTPGNVRLSLEDHPGGRFELDGVAVGEYELKVAAPGYWPFAQKLVVGDEPEERRVELEPAAAWGTVTSPGGPLAAVQVSLRAAGGAVLESTRTDEHGQYAFAHVPAVLAEIVVGLIEAPLVAPQPLAPADASAQCIVLPQLGTLTLICLDDRGAAVDHGRVTLLRMDGAIIQSWTTPLPREGRVSLAPLLPGPYQLEVQSSGCQPRKQLVTMRGFADQEESITLDRGT